MELESCISSLEKDADKCCSKGEEQHDIAKFLKVNELRKASKSKESIIKDSDIKIKKFWSIDSKGFLK